MYNIEAYDSLCRFYTRAPVGDLLVRTMSSGTPNLLVDLGAGGGTLSSAARRRWTHTDILTIDMDPDAELSLRKRLQWGDGRHIHHTHDALDPDLPFLVRNAGRIDSAICNPPYRQIDWKPGFERVLDDVGLTKAFGCPSDVTSDALFLAQNMRLVSHGGCIGLIVPDGMITGRRSTELRRTLLKKCRIEAVVQLPENSFYKTEAHAFILIIRNGLKNGRTVSLMRYDWGLGLSAPLKIVKSLAEHRMDYSFHALERSEDFLTTIAALGGEVRRGSINATAARSSGIPLFHTSDFSRSGTGLVDLPENTFPSGPATDIIVEPGDILLARIDRALHQKVAMVNSGNAIISDCVYRVRVPAPHRDRVYNALRSADGANRLIAASRGVGARHLGKQELLTLPLIPSGDYKT